MDGMGNKKASVDTYKSSFNFMENRRFLSQSSKINNTGFMAPVFLGENAEIDMVVNGSYVSIGNFSKISASRIQYSLIQKESLIKNANLANSMLGNFVTFEGKSTDLGVGDYNTIP